MDLLRLALFLFLVLLSLCTMMFYNKRSLLFNKVPGSGRNFIMQLLFWFRFSLHSANRLRIHSTERSISCHFKKLEFRKVHYIK